MMLAVSAKLCVRVGSSRSVISVASTPLPTNRPCADCSAGSWAFAVAPCLFDELAHRARTAE